MKCNQSPGLHVAVHALMESSEWQAPLGKRCWSGRHGHGGTARQLLACDGEALRKDHHQHGAYVYRIHHGGFTERKQALHDMLAGCWCCGETVEESAWKQQIWLRIVLGYPSTSA